MSYKYMKSVLMAGFWGLFTLMAQAEGKPNLVLLPIEVSEQDQEFESDYGTALEEGLQSEYSVFYGAEVERLLEKEYEKVDCTVESCNQNLAIAFNGELIADASVKKLAKGYLLKLRVHNVLSGQVEVSKSRPCRGCDQFDVIEALKTMIGATANAVTTNGATPAQNLGMSTKNIPPDHSSAENLTSRSVDGRVDERVAGRALEENEGSKAVVVFDSKPSGANVYINGEFQGRTPYQSSDHKVGEQLSLRIKKSGFLVEETRISVDQRIIELPSIQLRPDEKAIESMPETGGAGSEFLSYGKEVQSAIPIVRIEPRYPRAALQTGTEGWVNLTFDISETGAVTNVSVLEAQPKKVFNREAKRAVSKWKYRPKVINGKSVEQKGLQVRLDFNLN